MATTTHEAAVARRQAMLHTRAMARRAAAQKSKAGALQAKQASDKRDKSIESGATADAELEYGEQRNHLSRLLNDAPARYESINKVYDNLSTRVQEIAKARAEGAGEAVSRLATGYGQVGQAAAGSDATAQADLESKGFTGQAGQQMAADRMGAAGQSREALGVAGVQGQAGADNLYTMAAQAQLQKGENVHQSRVDDAQLRGTLLQTILNMGQAKTKAKADRSSAYAKADADAAAAQAVQDQTAQAERASVRSAQTKLDVSTIIALEKFGLGGLISAEKGSPQSVAPDIVKAILALANHGGKAKPRTGAPKAAAPKKKATAKKVVKKKAAVKKPVRHRTAGTRAAA